ncbi:MAG: hypothetical protein JW798_11490 [Prolixibacteraceae bacterium]|nr:hypothetical protein [Prolixibacteraceae bacterium]
MLLFVIVWIRFVQDENLKTRKFAIWSGIILAIGLATRYSMLPVMILPLFLLSDWKSKGIYILSGIVSFAVIIAPVMGHLNGIAMFSSTGDNGISIITTIFSHPEIVLFLIVFALLLRIIQKGDDKKRKINFFSGFIVVIVLQVAWGLIHENSLFYFPLFLLYGIFLFETGQLVEKLIDSRTNRNILFGIIPSLLFLTGCIHFVNDKVKNHEKDNLMAEASSLIKNIDAGTYLYFKPTSKAMPVIANALIYAGVKCKEFENQYRKISQNLITLEGEGITESYWQCNEAPFDSLLKKGVKLYVLSSSNFEAERMIAGLYQLAKVANIELARDIIFEHEKKGIVINCISGLSEPTVFEKLIIEKPEVILQEKTINIEIEVKKWEKKIRENAIWMEEIKQKAEHRNIPVDSMLYLDALYQAQKEK